MTDHLTDEDRGALVDDLRYGSSSDLFKTVEAIVARHVEAERERIAQAIEAEPWERWSDEGPPSVVADDQVIWLHGAGCGVRFAARIARGDAR